MTSLATLGVLEKIEDAPIELPVVFSLDKKSWWPWNSSIRGPFVAMVLVLPVVVGEARAVFSTILPGVEKRRQSRGPFESRRVKTELKLRIPLMIPKITTGKRHDTWLASPSEGWRIDLETIDFKFVNVFGGCWEPKERRILGGTNRANITGARIHNSREGSRKNGASQGPQFILTNGGQKRRLAYRIHNGSR